MLALVQSAVSLGLLWAGVTIGVFLTFRILSTPDLSVEGTIILGAATAARIISAGGDPFLATFLAILVGCLGGLVTGILHTKFKIPSILAGILTMIGSYSIVIRIMGTSNLSLLRLPTVFTFLQDMGLSNRNSVIVLGFVIVVASGVLLYCFLGTELGSAVRATGSNRNMARAQGINTDTTTILCLMISNGLVGLTGALAAQNQGSADVGMGIGTIAFALASLIIAEVLFPVRNVWSRLITLAAGAILYQLVIALVLGMGMRSTDLRLFQVITVILALSLPLVRNKLVKAIPHAKGDSKDA